MTNNRDDFLDDPTFSERHGYEPLPEPMQLEELSDDLRRKTWNALRDFLTELQGFDAILQKNFNGENRKFVERILGEILKVPGDEISYDCVKVMNKFKFIVMDGKFNKVLDLIEAISEGHEELFYIMADGSQGRLSDEFFNGRNRFIDIVKHQFDKYAAYRLDTSNLPFRFFPRSSKEEGEAIRQALRIVREYGMTGAEKHLREAAKHINQQEFGDAIRESIHAVESVACAIDPNASQTLGPALNSLEKSGQLRHPALKDAFKKLYGYTSDEQGIRHALIEKGSPDVGLYEAMFMFGACASFAAYLVNKHRQAEQQQDSDQ